MNPMPDRPLPTPIAVTYDVRRGRGRKVFDTNRKARRFFRSMLRQGRHPNWIAPYKPAPTLFGDE